MDAQALKTHIRDIADFPKPGILFRDVTPLLAHADALRSAVELLTAPFRDERIDLVVGTEARGFLFGLPVALELGAGFVPVRKPGKLPHTTREASYELEYGTDRIEMHTDAIEAAHRVLVVDDLIATGGTARATIELSRASGAEVVGCAFLIELTALEGRKRLGVDRVHAVLEY